MQKYTTHSTILYKYVIELPTNVEAIVIKPYGIHT